MESTPPKQTNNKPGQGREASEVEQGQFLTFAKGGTVDQRKLQQENSPQQGKFQLM